MVRRLRSVLSKIVYLTSELLCLFRHFLISDLFNVDIIDFFLKPQILIFFHEDS